MATNPATSDENVADIWQLIERKRKEAAEAAASAAGGADAVAGGKAQTAARETCFLVVGARRAGKSSLVQAYFQKDKEGDVRPTTSLDYKFARSSRGMSLDQDLSHFWELGGGRRFANLLQVPMSMADPEAVMCVLVVDLSRPWTVLSDMYYWLKTLRKLAGEQITRLRQEKSQVPNVLATRAAEQYGSGHEDLQRVDALPWPTLVVANKYDVFAKEAQSEQQRVMSRTLRTLCHQNGCSLIYGSRGHKQLTQAVVTRLKCHVVQKAGSKQTQTDYQKGPMVVPAGQDSYTKIGDGAALDEPAFARVFPRPANAPADDDDVDGASAAAPELQAEPVIDAAIASRQTEFIRVQREAQLKRDMRMHDVSGKAS